MTQTSSERFSEGCLAEARSNHATCSQTADHIFFVAVQFHLELPNLLVQAGCQLLGVFLARRAAGREHLAPPRHGRLLPWPDQQRVVPYSLASWLAVLSPFSAARATLALNSGLCCRRLPFMVSFLLSPVPLAYAVVRKLGSTTGRDIS